MGGQGQNLPGSMYWESHSMNRLTGQLIVHTYSTLSWPGDRLPADKSSAAWNKQTNKEILFKVKHVYQIHRNSKLIPTQTSKTVSNTSDNHETT